MKPPSPPHGAAAVKQPASSPDARLTPSSVVAAAAVGIGVTPPRRSCDDAASCVVNDVDAFARTIASIRSKPASAAAAAASSSSDGGGDHLATVLAHYAARWLPDVASSPSGRFLLPPQSPTATWIRKRLLLESLVAALPPDGGDGDDGGGGAALEAGLRPAEFEELARAVPAHARAADDGLYRAVDTYLKAHPHAGKEERRSLCRLIDARKLTAEAAAHAVQNERLPVRCVVQVLFSEHGSKLTRLAEWTTGSFRSLQSRSPADLIVTGGGANGGARCPSKREVAAQHHELRRLREDVSRLQVQCHALQAQVDRLSSERRRRPGGLFKLLFGGGGGAGATGAVVVDDSDSGLDRTPLSGKKGVVVRATAAAAAASTPASGTPAVARWRRSHS
uniref:NPH3 domain-containing protein n=1 Tax=Oryza glumipatula TaxID=40148 RepID=A0A0D9ZUV8_9ORYZ